MTAGGTNPLGFELYAKVTATAQRQGRDYAVIGHLHSPEEFLVTEDPDDGSVWVFPADLSAAWPLNADRSGLNACLTAFDRYFADGPRDAGPLVLTAEEMRERLARRKRGEGVRRTPPKPPVPHRKRLKQLREDFEAADRTALTPESWWSGALEEAKNDLI